MTHVYNSSRRFIADEFWFDNYCVNTYTIFEACVAKTLELYDVVDSLDPPTPPVKYPRTPGNKPEPDDNKLNAW